MIRPHLLLLFACGAISLPSGSSDACFVDHQERKLAYQMEGASESFRPRQSRDDVVMSEPPTDPNPLETGDRDALVPNPLWKAQEQLPRANSGQLDLEALPNRQLLSRVLGKLEHEFAETLRSDAIVSTADLVGTQRGESSPEVAQSGRPSGRQVGKPNQRVIRRTSKASPVKRLPRLPQVFDTAFSLPTGGKTMRIKHGDDLQAAFDEASLGDVIVLEANAIFTGNFKLPNKPGNGWIYVLSSELGALPYGVRVEPKGTKYMPKIVSPNSNPALLTVFAAHNFRFAGVEFSVDTKNYNLVLLGQGLDNYRDPLSKRKVADSVDELPYNIIFDRCYFHSTSNANGARVGINADGRNVAVVDSRIENFKDTSDSQAILTWNGSGPYKIVNNYIEASGENFMSGGADPAIKNLIPADLEIRGNYFRKRDEWNPSHPDYNGRAWVVKNLFELKNVEKILVTGNVFENCFGAGAQRATAIVLTARNQDGMAPWSAVRDVTFENNIIRHVGIGFRITGSDDLHTSQQTHGILIKNNLWYDINRSLYGVNAMGVISAEGAFPVLDLTIQNNLMLFGPITGQGAYFLGLSGTAAKTVENFAFEDNIVMYGDYGVKGDGCGSGNPSIGRFVSSFSFKRNVMILRPADRDWPTSPANYYPTGNFWTAGVGAVGFLDYRIGNFTLKKSSRFKNGATDGKDPGPDFEVLLKATKGAFK